MHSEHSHKRHSGQYVSDIALCLLQYLFFFFWTSDAKMSFRHVLYGTVIFPPQSHFITTKVVVVNGEKFESRSYNPYPYYSNIIIGSYYFKFKALKPSSNKISLKFPHTSPIEENYCKFNKDFCADYVIKINILPKEEAS